MDLLIDLEILLKPCLSSDFFWLDAGRIDNDLRQDLPNVTFIPKASLACDGPVIPLCDRFLPVRQQ